VSDIIAMRLTDIVTKEAVVLLTPNVLSNDTDIENDTLFIDTNGDGNSGTVLSQGDGTFFYTPGNGFVGLDKFSYTAKDGIDASNPAYVSVGVGVANYAPQGVSDKAGTVVGTPVIIDVLANDFDLDGDTLIIGTADTTSSLGGAITIDADNNLIYTPGTATGTDTFYYTAKDSVAETASTFVSVSVAP
jgi:hypothetical protein